MAARYWVGGTATWDGTAGTKWATTSGGAGGAAVPTAADDVYFDANSGAVTVTTSGTTTDVCRSIDFTGFTGTFNHANSTTVKIGDGTAGAGNIALKLVAGMTYTVGGTASALQFVSTSATQQTVTWASKTVPGFQFAGTGGSWQFTDGCTISASVTCTLTAGTLDFNGQTLSIGNFSSTGSTARTLTMGAANVTLTGGGWTISGSNMTFNANTSTITCSNSATTTFAGGGMIYNNVSMATGLTGATMTITGANTFNAFTWNGGAGGSNGLNLGANQTFTTFTVNGNSATNRILIVSNTVGTQRTLTAGTVSISNVDFIDIVGAGAGSWSGTSIGGSGSTFNNSGITFTTPVTRYAVASGNWSSTGMWSATSGGASGASVPLMHDTVYLDANSAAGTYTLNMARAGQDIDMTGFTRTFAGTSLSRIFGSLTLGSGSTVTSSQNITFSGRGSHTLNLAGKTLGGSITIAAGTGTYTLAADFVTSGNTTLTISSGTFDAATYNLTFATYALTAGTTNMGTGTWTANQTSAATVFNSSGGTLNAQTSTLAVTNTGANNSTITTGTSQILYNVQISLGGAGVIIFNCTTGVTINKILTTGAGTKSIRFTASRTYTLTDPTGFPSGTAGNVITYVSSSAGTAFTLSSPGNVRVDYISLKDCTATSTNNNQIPFYAGLNSTNVSGNTGWAFTAAPKAFRSLLVNSAF